MSRTSIHALITVILLGVPFGCDKDNSAPVAQTPAPGPGSAPTASRANQGIDNTPRSSLGGAKNAAHNTVNNLENENRKLETEPE